ncbi:hypothetical protein AYI70_g6870 [Smittium culicis]|uniref:Uncharacterized protein n=1 Tax=Smittium culicis TaxID=133412 RepID=A0A1R1XN08_9FUNG|nr:hypothetical protein AYI70_g6870 [Smittium culicis]
METQTRLKNLHSGTSFSGKNELLVESKIKPFINSEKFDNKPAKIKLIKRDRVRRSLCGHQLIEECPSPVSSITTKVPNTEAATERRA